jgi:hypothetical protein
MRSPRARSLVLVVPMSLGAASTTGLPPSSPTPHLAIPFSFVLVISCHQSLDRIAFLGEGAYDGDRDVVSRCWRRHGRWEFDIAMESAWSAEQCS